MAADLRRSRRGTVSAALNLVLVMGAGVILLANEYVSLRSSAAWVAIGVALLLWAGVIAQGLRRPVLISAEAAGVSVRRAMGHHFYRWEDLSFADFDGSPRAIILGGKINGNLRYAAVAKRAAELADLPALRAEFERYRPGLPSAMVMPGQVAPASEETEA